MESPTGRTNVNEVSMAQIIAAIQSFRDRQIDELMKGPTLMQFLEHYFDTIAISDAKKEFLQRLLVELKNSSLDLSFYSGLITQIKQNNMLEIGDHKLFLLELRNLFQKCGF